MRLPTMSWLMLLSLVSVGWERTLWVTLVTCVLPWARCRKLLIMCLLLMSIIGRPLRVKRWSKFMLMSCRNICRVLGLRLVWISFLCSVGNDGDSRGLRHPRPQWQRPVEWELTRNSRKCGPDRIVCMMLWAVKAGLTMTWLLIFIGRRNKSIAALPMNRVRVLLVGACAARLKLPRRCAATNPVRLVLGLTLSSCSMLWVRVRRCRWLGLVRWGLGAAPTRTETYSLWVSTSDLRLLELGCESAGCGGLRRLPIAIFGGP